MTSRIKRIMELASQSKSTNGTSNKKKKLSEAAPTYPSENIPGNDAVTLEDTNNKKNEVKHTLSDSDQDVDCYLWEETQGKRGAIEVASSIRDYLLAHPNIKEVRMMSDGCGGQQKNSIFGAMCLEVFSVHPSLVQIDYKFFETGHTEMECDSVHSKIEQKSKYVPVYSCEGWAQIIRSARIKPRPFVVKNLTHEDFLDFKTFGVQSFKLSQISWRKVFWIRYLKADQTKILYKFKYNDEFEVANITKSKGRSKKVQLNKAYRDELPINAAKFQDLQKMCSDLTIPKIYHPFYNSLKVSDKVRDRLPGPDVDEDPVNSDAEEDC